MSSLLIKVSSFNTEGIILILGEKVRMGLKVGLAQFFAPGALIAFSSKRLKEFYSGHF